MKLDHNKLPHPCQGFTCFTTPAKHKYHKCTVAQQQRIYLFEDDALSEQNFDCSELLDTDELGVSILESTPSTFSNQSRRNDISGSYTDFSDSD